MHPHTRNPFDTRSHGDPSTAKFLGKLVGSEDEAAYRKAMGEETRPSTADKDAPEFTPEELARLRTAEAGLRETQEKKDLAALKADYLAWAREFNLGGDDPQQWIAETFTFNPDGTVETQGDLELSYKNLTRLPRGLTRVNGNLDLKSNRFTSMEGFPQEIHGRFNLSVCGLTSLDGLPKEIHGRIDLSSNRLTSLDGLPKEIHGSLDLSGNRLLTSLDGLRGTKIHGNLDLVGVPATSIPPRVDGEISAAEGVELLGVKIGPRQKTLQADAERQGYIVLRT